MIRVNTYRESNPSPDYPRITLSLYGYLVQRILLACRASRAEVYPSQLENQQTSFLTTTHISLRHIAVYRSTVCLLRRRNLSIIIGLIVLALQAYVVSPLTPR